MKNESFKRAGLTNAALAGCVALSTYAAYALIAGVFGTQAGTDVFFFLFSFSTLAASLVTALLLLSGVLPLLALLELLGKLLLGLRQRSGLRLSAQGVLLERRLELCGRTLWDSRRWILRNAPISRRTAS